MGTITVGGLATGLDTNTIVTQLVALERRSIDVLETQRLDAKTREKALQTFNTKVLAFLTAVDTVRTADGVLVRKASSSDEAVLTATAGGAAVAGSTSLNVTALARGSIAVAANGKTSATATVAAGSGNFVFRVGSGTNQTVAVDGTTTLQGLASGINALDAGVGATVVNVGTAAAPDFRLRIASTDTGNSSNITIVTDDTTLGVATTQAAQNAAFTVSGFVTPLSRERNTFDDVIPGVALTLAGEGSATVTVTTDTKGVTDKVQAVVTAFNDIVSFVSGESQVTQDTSTTDREVNVGPLAFDGTVRTVLASLKSIVSNTVPGLSGNVTLLAQVGITTTREGTLAFNSATFSAALASDEGAVGALFGGSGAVGGVADRLHDYLTALTQSGGLIDIRIDGAGDRIATLEDQIAAGERHLESFEQNLRATFTNLEVLVSSLQSQGAFLQSALGRTSG